MFGSITLLRRFFTKNFWTHRLTYVALLPLLLSLLCFIFFIVFICQAYQQNNLPTHTSLWIGVWAAFISSIVSFQLSLSILFYDKIKKRIRFMRVYSIIVSISALGAFIGNCITKDGPGIGFSVMWLIVSNSLFVRVFLVKSQFGNCADVENNTTNETNINSTGNNDKNNENKNNKNKNKKLQRCKRIGSCCTSWVLPVFILIFGSFYSIEAVVNGGIKIEYPAPGQLIKMTIDAPEGSSYSMHIYCVGERKEGKPLIIMESGGGTGAISFFPLIDSLSNEFRMCAYDRSGYGWSQSGPLPSSDISYVLRLDNLLNKTNEHPPYVIVGHSVGGQLARLYQKTFPNKTAGIVQLDSVPQYTYWEEYYKSINSKTTPLQEDKSTSTIVDFIRVVFPIFPVLRAITASSDFPAKYKSMNSALYNSVNWNSQYWDQQYEITTFRNGSANKTAVEYLTPGSLGSLPTMVLYAPGDSERPWYTQIHAAQAAASTKGKLIECPLPCYHSFLWDRVDFISEHLRNFTNSI